MTDVFFEDNPFVGINRIRFIGYNLSPGFILWAPLCLYFGRKVKQKIQKADNNLYFLHFPRNNQDVNDIPARNLRGRRVKR